MASGTSWVNATRAEALAKIYLTRRPDLEVLSTSGASTGAPHNLLVRINGADTSDLAEFGIEVKGITQPLNARGWRTAILRDFDRTEDSDDVRSRNRGLPLCLFVFNIDSEEGLYMWLREPTVDRNGRPALYDTVSPPQADDVRRTRTLSSSLFQRLDKAALDVIVEKVVQWYREQVGPPRVSIIQKPLGQFDTSFGDRLLALLGAVPVSGEHFPPGAEEKVERAREEYAAGHLVSFEDAKKRLRISELGGHSNHAESAVQ